MSITEQPSVQLDGPPASPPDLVGGSPRVEWAAPIRYRFTALLAIVGAVAYCSWPLGFLVNPSLAGSALASSFESRNQPFSWLFILLDCLSGLCTVIVCLRFLHHRRHLGASGKAVVSALLGYAAFGVTTAVDAVIPLDCGASSARACAAQLWPLTPDDLLTGIAILAILVAVTIVVVQMIRTPLRSAVAAMIAVAAVGWCVMGLYVLLGSTYSSSVAFAQYGFLTLTSVLVLVVPLQAAMVLRSRSVDRALTW